MDRNGGPTRASPALAKWSAGQHQWLRLCLRFPSFLNFEQSQLSLARSLWQNHTSGSAHVGMIRTESLLRDKCCNLNHPEIAAEVPGIWQVSFPHTFSILLIWPTVIVSNQCTAESFQYRPRRLKQ
jgi:hypothetical protein